jgi:hypothetical protein
MSNCAICGLTSVDGFDHEDCFVGGTVDASAVVD